MAFSHYFGGGRFKELMRKYGKVALGVHFSVSAASIAGLYVAIKSNVDVESMLEKVGLGAASPEDQPQITLPEGEFIAGDQAPAGVFADQQLPKQRNRTAEMAASGGGALALAVLCNKALFPVRIPITIALTPPIARFLRARNIIKNVV